MRLHSVQDVHAPMSYVFQYMSNFETHLQTAAVYGALVVRTDTLDEIGVGATWHVDAKIRGKDREFDVELTSYSPDSNMEFMISSRNIDMDLKVKLAPAGGDETQVKIVTKSKPKSLSARLLVQSAKLAHKTISRRFDLRVQDLMGRIEEEYSAST